jgi:hypothetical protein
MAASVHMHFERPSSAQQPTWYYNQVVPTSSTSATYFATNTHGYGYAGIQQGDKDNTKGHQAICSIWDQSSGKAVTEKCGSGVTCKDFGGEGTGRQAIWKFQWKMGKRYAFALHRIPLANGQVRNICWFYASELKSSYPGGWKHIATHRSGRAQHNPITFGDAGSFLEAFGPTNTQDKRQGTFGPAYYKGNTGKWYQSRRAHFSKNCNHPTQPIACAPYLGAGLNSKKERLYMGTGGNKKFRASHTKPRPLRYPKNKFPSPLRTFYDNKAKLLAIAQ